MATSLVELVLPWDRQPNSPSAIDWENSLLASAIFVVPLTEQAGAPKAWFKDAVVQPTQATTFVRAGTSDGLAYATDATSATVPQFATSVVVDDFTVFWYGRVIASGEVGQIFQLGENYPTSPRDGAFAQARADNVTVRFEAYINGTGSNLDTTAVAFADIRSISMARLGTTITCRINGASVGTITVGSGNGRTMEKPLLGSHYFDASYQQNGAHRHLLFGAVNRWWSAEESQSFYLAPWQLFEPERVWVPFQTAGAGGGFFSRYYYDMIGQSRIGA